MKTPEIYPIELSSYVAKELVKKYFYNKFKENLNQCWGEVELGYRATLTQSGDVVVHVHHSSDDGFMMSSGPVLHETCKPYNEEQIEKLVAGRKFEIATEVYYRKLKEKEVKAILKVHEQLFPK